MAPRSHLQNTMTMVISVTLRLATDGRARFRERVTQISFVLVERFRPPIPGL